MKKLLRLSILAVILLPAGVFAASISISPENPIQGDPIMISVQATSTVNTISFDGKKLGIFTWKNSSTAFYGFDLKKKPGTFKIKAVLSSGEIIEKEVSIGERPKIEAPLGIPQKLGGDTHASAMRLVNTLAQENATLLGLRTGTHAFWTKPFRLPLENPIVTDTYGYSRQTVGQIVSHKGTDFRAKEGTPVKAMNRGVVRMAQYGRNYGNTIIIDHGLGLQTFYMHLSKIKVNVGELVLPEQVIGLAGQTGYAEKPHLHLTVRINEVSIDPMVFLGFFK